MKMAMPDVGDFGANNNLPLILHIFRKRQASDTRDKIYGLLGLVHGTWAGIIEPDYPKSVEEVYEQVFLA